MPPKTCAARNPRPQYPEQNEVEENGAALPAGNKLVVIGQELQLEENEQCDRADYQTDPGNRAQHDTHYAGSEIAWPREKLYEDTARQLAAQTGTGFTVVDLFFELRLECTDLATQHRKMK